MKEGEENLQRETDRRHGGCLVVCWLPMVELVFVVVYRLGMLAFTLEKAAVEEVEIVAKG